MAFSSFLTGRVAAGNLKCKFFNLTDVQSGGSALRVENMSVKVSPSTNETDSADLFTSSYSETVSGRTTVTVSSVTNNDDGTIFLVG